MRHARVTENRLRVHALPIETRKKSRRSCAVETTIVEAETDLGGVGQKILASGKTRGNIPLAKPFKMDVLLSIVKGKGVSNEFAPPSKLATFTENSDAKRDNVCGSGGIGRRAGLRILWPQGRGGSTPPFRTNLLILNSQFRNASKFDALNSFPYTHLSHPAGALFRTRLRQRNIRKRRYGVRLQSASFDSRIAPRQ